MRDDAFERLFDEHAVGLLNFLAFRTGDRALAEDLTAEAFEKALKARRSFDRRKGNEKSWLYGIALNLLSDHFRKRSAEDRAVQRRLESETDRHEGFAESVHDRHAVMAALGQLSAEEREIVALRFGARMRNPEIAEVTGEPLTTVEGRLYRALRKLRAHFDQPASAEEAEAR